MKILACLLLQTVIILSGNLCLAQAERIDSLKKALPTFHNHAKVVCLNQLSEHFLKFHRYTTGY